MPDKNDTGYVGNPAYLPTIMNSNLAYNAVLAMNGAAIGVSRTSDKVNTSFAGTPANDTDYDILTKVSTGFTSSEKQTTAYGKP